MSPPVDPRTAVVLSGGGAYGAYEVGVMKALFTGASVSTGYRPIDPGVLTGTSVGAFNAAFLVSQPGRPAAETNAALEEVWCDDVANTLANCGNGVFRVRGLPFQFFDPGCLLRPVQNLANLSKDAAFFAGFGLLKGAQFATSDASLQSRLLGLIDLEALISNQPLQSLLETQVDYEGMARSPKSLTVAASDWKNGTLRLFDRAEVATRYGAAVLLASAALPGVFPPVMLDDTPFVDGGVLLNTPLRPAITAGADTLHVIFVDPLVENIELQPLASSLDTFYRLFAILWAASMRKDVEKARAINRTLRLLAAGGAGALARSQVGDLLEVGERIVTRGHEGRPYQTLTVHNYRPRSDLGGGEGLLDFSAERMRALIDLGYRDTVGHDCTANGCSLGPTEAPHG